MRRILNQGLHRQDAGITHNLNRIVTLRSVRATRRVVPYELPLPRTVPVPSS